MVTNKYITKIISALMALAVILCLATSAFFQAASGCLRK